MWNAVGFDIKIEWLVIEFSFAEQLLFGGGFKPNPKQNGRMLFFCVGPFGLAFYIEHTEEDMK